MSDDWPSFLSEFRSLSSQLASRLSSIPRQTDISSQKDLLDESEQTAADLQSAIERIQSEIRHFDYSIKTRAQEQLNECREQFQRQQKTIKSYRNKLERNQILTPDSVVSPTSSDPLDPDNSLVHNHTRSLLLESRLDVLDAGDSLDRTTRILSETESMGAATSLTLVQQREQFVRQRDMLDETDTSLSRTRKLLKRMARRVVTNKMTTGIVIVVEMGLIALIAYLKYYR